ncbi:unnamed protein product [Owenia fusiformis]|nr:unnamed protein product [Owenia fusiformis]
MKQFGFDDSCYTLLRSYQVQPYDCWTIKPGMVHSPGPWPTLEVQRPQDDANHLAWVLGYVEPDQIKRSTKKSQEQLRGVPDEQGLLDHMVDFDGSRDPEFESRWRHKCLEISSGKWGRHFQIFFGEFYGEGMEINSNSHWVRELDERPYMAIVWSGSGKIQGKLVSAEIDGTQEILVTPGTKVTIENTDAVNKLLVYAVFPIRKDATNSLN